MPLCGSPGSISPSSIFVSIIRASLLNNSSTFSPDSAETSTTAGIADLEAQREATSGVTSLPAVYLVTVNLEPGKTDRAELKLSMGNDDCLLDMLDSVDVADSGSGDLASAKSTLLPASMTARFGEASALASMRNVGKALNDAIEATSYISIAPAAPL